MKLVMERCNHPRCSFLLEVSHGAHMIYNISLRYGEPEPEKAPCGKVCSQGKARRCRPQQKNLVVLGAF